MLGYPKKSNKLLKNLEVSIWRIFIRLDTKAIFDNQIELMMKAYFPILLNSDESCKYLPISHLKPCMRKLHNTKLYNWSQSRSQSKSPESFTRPNHIDDYWSA